MGKNKDVVISKINIFQQDVSEVDDPGDIEIEQISEIQDDDNPLHDPSLKERYFKNSTNTESFKKMESFDQTEIHQKIYDLLIDITGGKTLSVENEKDLFTEINQLFSLVINNWSRIKKFNINNLFSITFIEFSECIDVDATIAYKNLLPKYQNILMNELKSMIGEKSYNIYKKKYLSDKNISSDINSHDDVIIKKV